MYREKDLEYKAASDTANRARSGSFAYPVILLIIAVFTPFYEDHKTIVITAGVIIVIATIGRVLTSWFFEYFYHYYKKTWFALFAASSLVLAFVWGILCTCAIYFYAWDWPTMVTCLSGAAFSAGAVVTFPITLRLAIAYLVLMIVPVLITTLYINTAESLTATFLFATYLIFLISIAMQIHKEYWTALNNAFLLDERARELQAKNEELESFSYSVSHDLRAPLRSIDGFCDILFVDAGHKLNEEDKANFQRIRAAAQRMGNIIDDLLRLSRISRADFNPGEINLSELVQANIDKMRQQDPSRIVEVDVEPNIYTVGDFSLLDIAMQNIISNAWKYSSKSAHPKIRFAKSTVDGQTAYYIKDNGVGFDPRFYQKLFNPFQRLHHIEEFPGNGIGLATFKRIIQRHGGKVWAHSKVDKGSTFYFTLNQLNM